VRRGGGDAIGMRAIADESEKKGEKKKARRAWPRRGKIKPSPSRGADASANGEKGRELRALRLLLPTKEREEKVGFFLSDF